MDAKELILVDADENRNAYCKLIPDKNGQTFTMMYGRINNSRPMTKKYSARFYQEILEKKLAEGYCEVATTQSIKKGEFVFPTEKIENLFRKLFYYSSKMIKENYAFDLSALDEEKIKKAEIILEQLHQVYNLEEFNKILVQLFTTLPRKMKNVADFLAKSENDFPSILQAEDDLISILKTEKSSDTLKRTISSKIDFLKENRLMISEPTPEEYCEIKNLLGKESYPRMKEAYRVINYETEEKNRRYCEEHKVNDEDIRLLFHGSRNENWLNILLKGLILNAKAIITGKMFGYGNYFAPRAKKSIGYTSLPDARWNSERQSEGYLAIYKVAMPKTYHINTWKSWHSSITEDNLKRKGYLSVFAHKGATLVNDECIVYNEAASTIKYLIRIE